MAAKKETKEKKPNPLFELINALFTNKEYVNNITAETAKQSLFMVLRRVAIQHPLQANLFNDGKVNALDTIKFLSDYLYCGYTPKWVYTSGATKSKADKSVLSNEEIKLYKKHHSITNKDFDDAMRFFPDELINEIKEVSKFYKNINSLKGNDCEEE